MIKKSDAKKQILAEWYDWWAENCQDGERASIMGLIEFWEHLKSEKPQLLDFRGTNKYQIVQAWLSEAGVLDN